MNPLATSAEMSEHLERWRGWARTEVDALVDLAVRADLHGGGEWDQALARWSVTPLAPQERSRHARVGPPRSSGPPPIEVRHVARAVAAYVGRQLDELERSCAPPLDVQARIDRLRHELCRLEEEGLRSYLRRVRPPLTTASIFATARATSRRHLAQSKGPGVSTLTCNSCGAPRTAQAQARVCEFCGSKI